ncbi:hypothetical protein CAEBREN_10043 [Caenorhabditis brenneri]|uniref:Uncharacterized protein n=1 Tax=Caenorhabditis brenneri TaxID=135651 RepID=G0NQQ6_CAEBE|nr:hypothetical protein CAEBREN_10043 [Caenorhabditis brenneri]
MSKIEGKQFFPHYPNVFKLEMTPSKPVITSDDPMTVTLKNMATEKLEVVVEIESYLFEIVDSKLFYWPKTQVFRAMAPGETMSFQIGVMRETPKDELKVESYCLKKMKTPEGFFRIMHKPAKRKRGHEWNMIYGSKVFLISDNIHREHGWLEMEMSYEGETEVIKKRKEQFNAVKKQIEEDEKKQEEKEKKRETRMAEIRRLEAEREKEKKKCSISFQPQGCYENEYVRYKKSEGLLKISHQPTDKKGDTDQDWGFTEDEGDIDFEAKGYRVVRVYENKSVEHGYFEMKMSYGGETEMIKKRKERFNAIKKQIKEDRKKEIEEGKNPNLAKSHYPNRDPHASRTQSIWAGFRELSFILMTPAKPVITSDVPMTVTLKNMATERQEVVVEIDSYLFEIIDRRAREWLTTQVYHVMAPGETLSFQIGVMKETPKGYDDQVYVRSEKSPEGLLKISHRTTDKKGDTDTDWGFSEDENSFYFVCKGWRVVSVNNGHGYFEMKMSYVGETEVIKKRKEQFNAVKKQIEEDEKKKKEKERLEAEKKKKKKKCCSIL